MLLPTLSTVLISISSSKISRASCWCGADCATARPGPADEDVALGEAGRAESPRHRLGGDGVVADAVDGVDLDQLLEDLARELLVRLLIGGRLSGRMPGARHTGGEREKHRERRAPHWRLPAAERSANSRTVVILIGNFSSTSSIGTS